MVNIGCSISNVIVELDLFSQTEYKHGGHNHSDDQHHSHGDQSGKKSSDKEDDGCCDDETTAYFLSATFIQAFQVQYNFSQIQFAIVHIVLHNILSVGYSLDFFTDSRPPPDILPRFPDIRIFIQSFQI